MLADPRSQMNSGVLSGGMSRLDTAFLSLFFLVVTGTPWDGRALAQRVITPGGRPAVMTQEHPWESYPGSLFSITLERDQAKEWSFKLTALSDLHAALLSGSSSAKLWIRSFKVFSEEVPGREETWVPLSGVHKIQKGVLIFYPLMPLQPERRYRAVFDPGSAPLVMWNSDQTSQPLEVVFSLSE